MCTQTTCPKAETCYRIQATPSYWQSMALFNFTVTQEGVFSCDNYYPIYENTHTK
jgi:hypothetical protein